MVSDWLWGRGGVEPTGVPLKRQQSLWFSPGSVSSVPGRIGSAACHVCVIPSSQKPGVNDNKRSGHCRGGWTTTQSCSCAGHPGLQVPQKGRSWRWDWRLWELSLQQVTRSQLGLGLFIDTSPGGREWDKQPSCCGQLGNTVTSSGGLPGGVGAVSHSRSKPGLGLDTCCSASSGC